MSVGQDDATGSTVTIGELAAFVTSKNAGPFLVTIDAVFASRDDYERVRDSGLMSRQLMAELYRCPVENVVGVISFDPAKAIKVTLRRPVASGGFGDTDVYGAQQHVPLMTYRLPRSLVADRAIRNGSFS